MFLWFTAQCKIGVHRHNVSTINLVPLLWLFSLENPLYHPSILLSLQHWGSLQWGNVRITQIKLHLNEHWHNTHSIHKISKCEKRGGVSPLSFALFSPSPGPLSAADKTHTEMLPFRQLPVSKCCSSSFIGLKPWMDMFLTGVCLQGTLVILRSAENNRVMLSSQAPRWGWEEDKANNSVLAAGNAATAASSMKQFIPQFCVQTAHLSFRIMIWPQCPPARQHLREGQKDGDAAGEADKKKQK